MPSSYDSAESVVLLKGYGGMMPNRRGRFAVLELPFPLVLL